MARIRKEIEASLAHLLGEVDGSPKRVSELTFASVPLEEPQGTTVAVDGGQSVVADLGSCGVMAIRAGYTIREPGDRFADHIVHDEAHLVTRRTSNAEWERRVRPRTWGAPITTPAASGHQWIRAWCESERTVAEFDAAMRGLKRLREGDLLLVDGSLEAEPTSAPLVENLLATARRMKVAVAGVSKDTALSFDGTLPFTLELEEAARRIAAPARFAVDATSFLDRSGPFRTYGARWDQRASVYRVDIATDSPVPDAVILGRLLALCNDVAYPGYPYPLARIHERVHYADHDAVDLRRELEALVAERRGSGFSQRVFGRGRDVLALGA